MSRSSNRFLVTELTNVIFSKKDKLALNRYCTVGQQIKNFVKRSDQGPDKYHHVNVYYFGSLFGK